MSSIPFEGSSLIRCKTVTSKDLKRECTILKLTLIPFVLQFYLVVSEQNLIRYECPKLFTVNLYLQSLMSNRRFTVYQVSVFSLRGLLHRLLFRLRPLLTRRQITNTIVASNRIGEKVRRCN